MPSNISTPEGLLEALNLMGNKLNELVGENGKLKVSQSNAVGIRRVIQSGIKELVPKKFANVGQSGSLKSLAREGEDYARIADPETLELSRLNFIVAVFAFRQYVKLSCNAPSQHCHLKSPYPS